MSINIVKISEIIKDLEKSNPVESDGSFFKRSSLPMQVSPNTVKDKQYALNVDMWNNARVASQTGYTIEMLKTCIKKMIKFIR